MYIAARGVRRCLPDFAVVFKILQKHAIFSGQLSGLGRIFFLLDTGAVFAPRERFFRIPRIFRINLAWFSSKSEHSRRFALRFLIFMGIFLEPSSESMQL